MTSTPSDRSPSRPQSKVKIGLQADFEQMLSTLPDGDSQLESETVPDEAPADATSSNRPAVGIQADFSQMLSDLPHAPEESSRETVEEEDFRVKRKGPQFARPDSRRAAIESRPRPIERPAGQKQSADDEGEENTATRSVSESAAAASVSCTDSSRAIEPAPSEKAWSAVRKSDPEVTPPRNIFGINEDEAAAYLREQETTVDEPESTPRPPRKRPAASTTTGFTPPPTAPEPTNEASITDSILAELEKYSIASASQLRIAVHGGAVTIIGDVPGDYEKQLIVHFCKKVPGVTDVTDMMRVVGGGEAAAAAPAGRKASRSFASVPRKAPKAPPKNWKPSGYTLQLPFRAKHVGIVTGFIAMVWAGFTFATRDGSRLSLSPVTGRVLVDGAPAEGASVVFHPLDPKQDVKPRGAVGADGTFKLTTYLPGDGAPSGDYKVTVEWYKLIETPQGDPTPGPNLLPSEWSKPETTVHKVTVSGSTELPPFQVTR